MTLRVIRSPGSLAVRAALDEQPGMCRTLEVETLEDCWVVSCCDRHRPVRIPK